MERSLLLISTFCYLLGFARTMYGLGARHYRPSNLNLVALLVGFLAQTSFLYLRGETLGRCPLSNLFEVINFLTWSIVLIYLSIGSAYRMSILGAFTSPLVFLLQLFAMLAPIDKAAPPRIAAPNPWLELHAALSVIAYGAFGLAFVAGAMYLVQERQLKTHNIQSFFFRLPPIADLGLALRRLLVIGFALLTAGVAAGLMVNVSISSVKAVWSMAVWLLYGLLLLALHWKRLSARRVALLAVAAFTVALSSLWAVSFLGAHAWR